MSYDMTDGNNTQIKYVFQYKWPLKQHSCDIDFNNRSLEKLNMTLSVTQHTENNEYWPSSILSGAQSDMAQYILSLGISDHIKSHTSL